MKKRLEVLLTEVEMSPSQFADEIGVQRATISHIVSGRNNPSLDFIQKVLERFPGLNAEWIINGTGNVWKAEAGKQNETLSPIRRAGEPKTFQPNLFEDQATAFQDIQARPKQQQPDQNIDASDKLHDKNIQSLAGKREIVKVIILYSDSSFTAFDNNVL